MASSRRWAGRFIFFQGFLQDIRLHAQIRIHPLQPTVLFFQSLHLTDHRSIHAAIFRAPSVKRRVADPMLPVQVRNRDAALSLADQTHNLGISKAITLHQNLLILTLRKFSLKANLFMGDYHLITLQPRRFTGYPNPTHCEDIRIFYSVMILLNSYITFIPIENTLYMLLPIDLFWIFQGHGKYLSL
ncbi:hypothetical protein SXCC_04237 [Gluconacetobacter sp. SXCC-1]|nr:hypothetical protein SXCC_04237 [Gluconacetobacter sp. SXCC-1]